MKKVFLLLFLAIAACTVTKAQDSTSHRAKHRAVNNKPTTAKTPRKNALSQVNLTKDQQVKLRAANKNFKTKSQKIKNDSTLTAAQKRSQLADLQKAKKKSTDTVLTTEQKNKLKQIRKERKANSPQNPKPSPKTTGATKR